MHTKPQHFDTRQYMRRSSFEIFRYKDAYLREVALHHHDFYEVYFFLSGNVQYNIESRSYLLTPGDILLISPMELHQPVFHDDQKDYERIVLWINQRFLSELSPPDQDLTACFDSTLPGHTNLLRPTNAQRQLLSFQLERLTQETQAQDNYSALTALTYLAQILISLNRLAISASQSNDNRSVPDSVVYGVLAYINEQSSEDLTLAHLANRFFISKYHLSREFGRIVGTSVHRYLIQKRLAMAKQMMSSGMSSSEVYQQCGFGDYSNFYRAFKAEYQITPKEFAARLKNPPAAPLGHLLRDQATDSTAIGR